MGYVLELIAGLVGNDGSQRFIFIILVAGAVFALGVSGVLIFSAISNPLRRRLSEMKGAVEWKETDGSIANSDNGKGNSYTDRYLKNLAKLALPNNELARSGKQLQLIRAGVRSESALGSFYGAKTVSLVVLGFIVLMITRAFPELRTVEILFYIVTGAYVGFIIPNMVLDRMEARRVRSIRNAFPDALDLFVVCVEAGLGLTATIQRVGNEMEISHPELAAELQLVSSEMRLGVDRITALRGMAIRTGLEEIRGLVALIDQSVRFGTGIAETLRVYSEEFRDKRTQKAEEEAAKIGTKLIFPLTFCIWPGFFLVAIGPAILAIFEAFK